MTISVSGLDPNSELIVSFASIEIAVGTGTTDGAGNAVISVQVPDGFEPGGHHIRVREVRSGQLLSVSQINIFPPVECVVGNTTGQNIPGDADGDNVSDACDRFPTDGPAADFDGDGISNFDDNCPRVPNAAQAGLTRSPSGLACDPDQGFNPASQLFLELTGAAPSPTQGVPLPDPVEVTEPTPAVELPDITNAPEAPSAPFGFGLVPNPQPAAPVVPATEPEATEVPPSETAAPAVQPAGAVQPPPVADVASPGLAVTGAESRPFALVGLLAVGIGSLTLGLVRRRSVGLPREFWEGLG